MEKFLANLSLVIIWKLQLVEEMVVRGLGMDDKLLLEYFGGLL